jgi:hypothetical protein
VTRRGHAKASAGATLRENRQGFGRNDDPNGELLEVPAKSRDPQANRDELRLKREPQVNRRSSGFDGNPKPKKPIGFGRHGASEENRQGFGFDGDPNRDERPASAGTGFRPEEPTSFGWHGISGKANRHGFGRTRRPDGDMQRLRPMQDSGRIAGASATTMIRTVNCSRFRPKAGIHKANRDELRLETGSRQVNRHGASAPGGDPGEAPRSFGFETRIQGEPRKASAFRGEPNGMEA